MRVLRIDHVAVAVKDLDKARGLWEVLLGVGPSVVESLPQRGVRAARFEQAGGGAVELITPLGPDSPLAGFLEKEGDGLHHICFEVEDIEAAMAELKDRGFELLQDRPVPGAQKTLVAFLHPRSCGGVLVEIRESGRPQD